MQLPWFTLLPPRGYGVLSTTGRNSGKKRRKCVRVIRSGDKAYLVSLRGPYGAWLRNVRVDVVSVSRLVFPSGSNVNEKGRLAPLPKVAYDVSQLERTWVIANNLVAGGTSIAPSGP